jgi:hypothetical protein
VRRVCLAGSLLVLLVASCDRDSPLAPSFARVSTPVGLTASAVAPIQINLTWQDNSTNETGFEVHRSTTGPSGTFSLRGTTSANVATYSDMSLDPSTQYCYQVRAFETRGNKTFPSQFSSVSCATTPAAPPPPPAPPIAPSATDAKPTNSTVVEVTWRDNSSNEDGFQVERSTNGGTSYWTITTTGPNATSVTDSGRNSEFLVCYRVLAFNSLGESARSPSDCTSPPGAPTNLTAGKVDQRTVLIAWSDNSSHEDAYQVERSTAEAGPFAVVATVPAHYGYGIVSYRDSVPSTGTAYWYRVRARTWDGGSSDFSNTAAASANATPPAAPSGASATSAGGMNGISWVDNSTNEEGFRVERSTDGGTSWVTAFTVGVNYQGYGESWFVAEQQVCYRVFAFNGVGASPPSNTACTVLPATPGPLTATLTDQGTIDLAWNDNSAVEDTYELQRADFECSGGEFYTIALLPANATGFSDVPNCGTEYVYQVKALKGAYSYSGFSNQASVSIPPPPPPPLGTLDVATGTSGVDLDPDGYALLVDGGSAGDVGANAVVTFTLAAGDHSVGLSAMAANCAVEGANPRNATVVEGVTTRVDFSITCAPSGRVQVTTMSTGVDLDPDGFGVSVDGGPSQAIATNGAITIVGLPDGEHLVRMFGAAANCDITSPNPERFSTTAGQTAAVSFSVACGPVTQLAFANGGIYSINSNGTGARQLTAIGQASMPAWSPDGSKIAFVSYHEGAIKIYVMNADGSNLTRLTSNALAELHPTWSPDGARIAFSGNLDGNSDLYVMKADGTNLVQLTNTVDEAESEPAWSPDGSRIAFRSDRADRPIEIYVMNTDGTGVVRLTNNQVNDFDPAWSPDGTKLAFTSGSYQYDIYVMNADGTNPVRITSVGASEPTWSPDGRSIAFLQYDEIWVVRADGSDPAPLTPGSNPAWRR